MDVAASVSAGKGRATSDLGVDMKMRTAVGVAIVAAVIGFWVGSVSVGGQEGQATSQPAAVDHPGHGNEGSETAGLWTCPMHPQIQLPDPGDCPICGMDLVPMKKDDLGPRQFAMSEAARKLASIETTPVQRRFVTRPVRLVGKIDYDETVVKSISARVAGRLDRLYVDYTGVTVQAGDHLVWLYSPALLTAQQELLEARKRIKRTAGEQSQWLRDSNLEAFESAKEKLLLWGLTKAQIQGILDRGKAEDHMMITSPVGGVVIHKALNEGDYVKEGTRIYQITDLGHLWVRLDAYEQDLPWIRYGQSVTIQTEAMPGRDFEGWISFVDPVVEEKTRTIKVRVNVANPDGRLKPGMFVRAVVEARLAGAGKVIDPQLAGKWICPMHPEIVRDRAGDCPICGMDLELAEDLGFVAEANPRKPLVVPVSAVLVTGKRAVVYVQVPGKKRPTFEGREVILGPRAGNDYIILEGLKENEKVVTQGAFRIDSSLQILAKPSMMSQKGGQENYSGMEVRKFRASLLPLFDAYLDLHKALAADDAGKAMRAFETLAKTLQDLHGQVLLRRARTRWEEEKANLVLAAARGEKAQGLDDLRLEFANFSKSLLVVATLFGQPTRDKLYEAFCPMAFDNKGASWIQIGETIHNPFFGKAMQSCGEIRREFEGKSEVEMGRLEAPRSGSTSGGKSTSKPGSRPTRQKDDHQKTGVKKAGDKQVQAPPSPIDLIFPGYLRLQEALATDDLKAAESITVAMKKKAQGITGKGWNAETQGQWKGFRSALADAEAAKDLGGIRKAFEPLSKRLLALEALLGHGGKTSYYKVHCPMAFDNKGADWIQAGKEVKNPYYGKMMSGCGSVIEELEPRGGR